MDMRRFQKLFGYFFLSAACFAQPQQTVATIGTHMTVMVTGWRGPDIIYRITNNANQPLTAYTIRIERIYDDGEPVINEYSVGFGPSEPGILPGESYEGTTRLDLSNGEHGGIVKYTVIPLVAIYKNGTAEATDLAAFHRIADVRVRTLKALEVSVGAIQQALSDGSADPAAKAALLIQEQIKQIQSTYGPGGHKVLIEGAPIQPNEHDLKDVVTNLNQAGRRAAQENMSERQYFEKYLSDLETKLNAYREYANVHLGGVQ
jgi:hypothetical protein